jgi:adenylosuccinate synthase
MKKATIICDMQYGSTGKGLIAGYLAERDKPDVVVTSWSMNAGHTFINADGVKYIHCMLANGIVSPNLEYVLLGAGSQIGLDKLFNEVASNLADIGDAKILIHENACIISQRHIDIETATMVGIGSTMKGCGAAIIEKIGRNRESKIIARDFQNGIEIAAAEAGLPIYVITHAQYIDRIIKARKIQVEGAQGYSLGINSGFYPFVTSRECTPAQIASDCMIPLPMIEKVVGTMRTYPIRVANRFNEKGEMIGYSGHCYPDQEEVQFDEIGQPVEFTTVTKLPRRIFTFSHMQCFEAMAAIMPDEVFLNFANYTDPDALEAIKGTIDGVADYLKCGGVKYMGYGATSLDVKEI